MTDLSDVLEPERTALLIVDAQNAFAAADSPLVEAGLDLSETVATVPKVEQVLELARQVGMTVAFSRSVRNPDQNEDPASRFDIVPTVDRGETICWAGNWDAQYLDQIDPAPEEYEVVKQGFNAFHGTDLDYYLRTEGVDTLVVCGFVTDVCVEGTARGAHERGYDLTLVSDASASYTENRHRMAVDFVDSYLGAAVSVADIREALTTA